MTESKPDTALPFPYWTDGINDPKDTSRLVKRVKLSDLMNYDPRASYRHKRLWEFHLGWAHKDYGWTSLASVRLIRDKIQERSPDGKTMSTRSIVEATKDLLDWSYLIEAEKGRGHRGSRYHINWDLLDLAANGQFPIAYHLEGHAISVLPRVTQSVSLEGHAKSVSVSPVGNKDPNTTDPAKDGASCIDIDIPQATLAAEGGVLAGFDLLAATYDKPGDDLAKARTAYEAIAPDANELARMVKAAASWKASAKGPRMSLERWLREKRWLSTEEFTQDNRPSTRYPASVVTWIKPASGGEGAKVKYRDVHGDLQTQQLDADELDEFRSACECDRPAVRRASDDLHEFIGARFVQDEDGIFCGYRGREAA